jgi:hypothetical protein
VGLLGALVVGATPAAAHNVSGGALPAPPWLLAYIGGFLVIVTAVALRATWPKARRPSPGLPAESAPVPGLTVGRLAGLVVLVLVAVAAIVGPDSAAANISPVAVLVIWLALPIVALLVGDVMRALNPFVAVLALARRPEPDGPPAAPEWTSAAFLAAFVWFFLAYHQPGSPRSLTVFLAVYVGAALVGGWSWGRRWMATGEAFGGVSAAVALLSLRRRQASPPPGLSALMVVWLGSTAFDAFASTPFWLDVLGASRGWGRTALNTLGLGWLIAIVAVAYLGALRLAGAGRLAQRLGLVLLPLSLAWFIAHEVTLLILEGQNLVVLLSDPLGRGWDLFGTFHDTIHAGIVRSRGIRWLQLALLAAGHVLAVVLAHDAALAVARRREAMRITWAMAGASALSIVASALMVLG